MLNDFTGADKVYIACGYTDLRKGIDGLARLVQQQFALDPFANIVSFQNQLSSFVVQHCSHLLCLCYITFSQKFKRSAVLLKIAIIDRSCILIYAESLRIQALRG